jgi:hypothetical protein
MIGTWWLMWLVFMVVFCASPVGYGWAYRGWGPPVPRYVQRRRALRDAANAPITAHEAWGWAGDFVWIVLFGGVIWAIAAFLWGMR